MKRNFNWKIAKQFDLCYGHRVWSQELNVEYSLDSCLACRHLHGHQGTIIVYLEGSELERGMVTDFKNLNWFKKFVDEVLDHKFIIDLNDPLFNTLLPHYAIDQNLNSCGVNFGNRHLFEYHSVEDYYTPILQEGLPKHINEMYEGFIIVNFVPTSENLANWLYHIVQEKMSKIGIKTHSVQFFETPKSQTIFTYE